MHAVWTGTRTLPAALLIIAVVLGAPFVSSPVAIVAAAQDDEDDGGASAEDTDGAGANAEPITVSSELTVGIVAGACDTPDANTPMFELPGAAPAGVSASGETYASEGDVAASLGDLLAVPQVIAVGLNDVDFSIPIACAAIEGTVAGGKLIVGLLAAEGGDLTGIAVLSESSDGTATHVETYLIIGSDADGDMDGDDDEDQEEDTVDGEGGV